MELAALVLFLVGVAVPFLAPLLIVVASPNRWIYLASLLTIPTAPLLVAAFYFGDDPGPAGIAFPLVASMAVAGGILGAAFWGVEIWWRGSGRVSWRWSATLYTLAALLVALQYFPWR